MVINLPMKRSREEKFDSLTSMANCLMLLSGRGENNVVGQTHCTTLSAGVQVFECKTCSRQFPSFQALGGHRASHRRPRAAVGDSGPPPAKPKTHECSICSQEFGTGQALGGHMSRHKAVMNDGGGCLASPRYGSPVVKIPAKGRRVLCLDLNLTPLENGLKLIKLEKMATQIS